MEDYREILEDACRRLEWQEAEAWALVLAHEEEIERLVDILDDLAMVGGSIRPESIIWDDIFSALKRHGRQP